jgi:hypothetical protein
MSVENDGRGQGRDAIQPGNRQFSKEIGLDSVGIVPVIMHTLLARKASNTP